MYTFIEFLCLIGILFFIIKGIISFFKMNGKSLKNFIIAGALFFLFIFTSIADPSNEVEHKEATEKDKSIKPTKVIYKTEHSKLDTVQKEKTKISKPKNSENLIKSCKNRVGCKTKSDKAPIQEPKKVKIEKGTYRIVFMVYGLM
ncbi:MULTISPECIES: hypothetical protein [Bacillaceae]|uniref:hypothetical protein n=1 Tax=Bacillaceae TaxID=186817 RepID=UPI000BEBB8B1|nr:MULTISPECIES: hypothetical protein [unclassified Bacillus (in: firmicutes)]PEC51154.1 hypothetical protein CON00_03715 [Bacillus sp. AFS096315]PFM77535.1 hypothetical protein COJ46_18680 [Bacillus sp. AFS077874]